MNLLQFSFPHGITNGAPVTVQVVDDGSGVDPALPISSFGRLSTTTTYYAISGITNSLEDDQLRLALTQDNANIGDFLSFTNAGDGRQVLLTDSFGGAAEANVITDYTGDFTAGERLTGTISKASGTVDNLSIAKGVLEVGAITSTPGRFIDDVGKPSEIIQKIQDSYFYQDFSYSVKAPG